MSQAQITLDLPSYPVTVNPNGTRTVTELNANVLTATFKGRHHARQFADLYSSPNECNVLVYHGSCGPVNATYIKTVQIEF